MTGRMNLNTTRISLAGIAGIAFGVALAAPAAADVASFYKNKTMTMYVGVSAGGGYDAYARTIAQHIVRHIPGNPRMIVKNLTGAGGMRMTNSLYNVFRQDGTNIAIMMRNLVSEPLFGNKAARYDGSKFQWLGSANQEYSLCTFWHTSPIKTYEDLISKPGIVGGISKGSTVDVHARLVNNLLGGQLRLVTGYPGGADINLATERGEVDGRCGWSWSSINATGADWLRDKKISLTIQFAMKKHPDLPNIPLVRDMVTDPADKQALDVHLAPQVYGRPFATGPKVPADRAAALRAAFWATMTDPVFLAAAKKRRLQIDPTPGEQVAKLVKAVYAMPREIIERARIAGTSSERTQVSKAVVPVETHMGKISGIKSSGRRVSWAGGGKTGKLRVSGRRTAILIAGKKAKRKALQVGMSCAFTVKGAQTALKIDCK